MNLPQEFQKYATMHKGISSLNIHRFESSVNNQFTNGYINPTIIEERQLNIAQLDVFSRMLMDRILFLGVPIDDNVSNIIQAQLLFLDSTDNKDISIYINSPGGGVYAGLGIFDTMKFIKSDVSTISTGLSASMGCVLLAAGTKGKRFALKHSRIMAHQPLGAAQGQATDMEITVKEINKLKKELYDILAESSGQSYETIWKDSERDNWMTAHEAKEYGFIDQVLLKKP